MEMIAKTANINFIEGNNFSGRSNYLKSLVKTDTTNILTQGVMIGEIPSNYISGLAPTVKGEILLHTAGINKVYGQKLNEFLVSLSFEKHFDKNPFSLSGGEQAILSIISALLLEPKVLAIDTTIEQLNKEWRTPLLQELISECFIQTKIFISDNRFEEYGFNANRQKPIANGHRIEKPNEHIRNIKCPSQLKLKSTAKNLALSNINFRYSQKEAILKNLNYEFEAGKIYRLNGANGAGKSTLAKILTGVLKPADGRILVQEQDYNAHRFPGKVVGYSFQNPDEQLFSNNIKSEIMPKEFLKVNKDLKNAEAIISAFGLDGFLKKHPSEMPFVVRKRIALAATLANERDWYILDEPTIGQDYENISELTNLIRLLAMSGKGVILISHSESFIDLLDGVTTISIRDGNLIN